MFVSIKRETALFLPTSYVIETAIVDTIRAVTTSRASVRRFLGFQTPRQFRYRRAAPQQLRHSN